MNKHPIRPWLAVTAAAACLVATPARASLFSNIFFLGDSVSDSGNVSLSLAALSGNPADAFGFAQSVTGNSYIPSLPYAQTPPQFGVVSNGPVWTQYFAPMLGHSTAPSVLPPGGNNFAFASARSGGAGGAVPSLVAQSGMLLASLGGVAPADALYVVASVGNDARDTIDEIGAAVAGGTDPADAIAAIGAPAAQAYADHIGGIVDSLQAAGARHLLVLNTANIGLVPAAAAGPAGTTFIASAVSNQMNGALGDRLFGESGVDVFDTFALFNGVAAAPAAYGFDNATDACGALAGVDCSKYVFWDGIHPTTAAHRMLADAVYAQVVPEPQTWAMLVAGLIAVAGAARRRVARA